MGQFVNRRNDMRFSYQPTQVRPIVDEVAVSVHRVGLRKILLHEFRDPLELSFVGVSLVYDSIPFHHSFVAKRDANLGMGKVQLCLFDLVVSRGGGRHVELEMSSELKSTGSCLDAACNVSGRNFSQDATLQSGPCLCCVEMCILFTKRQWDRRGLHATEARKK